MTQVPAHLQDAKDLLSQEGFTSSNIWYHGTSSALVDSIKSHGLKRSGDKALKQAAKKTMATIGNDYSESIEPVFLTQSKELAHYWATCCVRERAVRFEGEEQAVVIALTLPEPINSKVKPDVGAASLLLIEGEKYMPHLASIYESCGLKAPDIDLMKAGRLEYLHKLGMAYIDADIATDYIDVLG